ncbi:aldo/keto reductase [Spirochaetia bacterium 38H-sp]|uniref:Aldo/keto reductase n=1 Tax=Rarispira pelagica TaxID=3141764 RepID=A0ABU9U9A2_9SPIR
MHYRELPKLGVKLSSLGFGCMRLPVIASRSNVIDKTEASRIIKYAIDKGLNYLDTAWPYHGGTSEAFVGEFVSANLRREDVFIATKLPVWEINNEKDADRIFYEQLKRLRTDYIDFYLLHSLNKGAWQTVERFDLLSWLDRKVEEGKIRFRGFSFHDELSEFKRYVDSFDWDFCQIQYNYMNENYQAGTEGFLYASKKGIPVIVMEPLLGGYIAKSNPLLETIWKESGRSWSPVEWAFRWLWNKEGVAMLLSGMSTMEQVEENVSLASSDAASVGNLSSNDLAIIARVREKLESSKVIPCTACNYCQPCPNDVEIPRIFKIYNDSVVFSDVDAARGSYRWIPKGHRASDCVECGECLEKCPQSIEIIDWLKKSAMVLEV